MASADFAMPEFTVVVPARYGSTRLPGKPLLEIAGEPMVAHVWRRACLSHASRVVVATDDSRIREAMLPYGAEVIMTRADHPSGTDRLAEVADILALADDPEASIATLAEPINDVDTLFNPNVVKVVRTLQGRALYFSRAPIPWDREHFKQAPTLLATDAWLRHIGLYAYRAGFLAAYRDWPASSLEQLEQLEQLRALQNGHAIQVALACEINPAGVDTAEDLERVRALLTQPKL